mmetsp:Transcript_44967/g.119197  ORF Transcript_44967/g.119197 Transcript_44967/m.119197 type:complete len:233 (-) Transcript_44967:1852-2550(-)
MPLKSLERKTEQREKKEDIVHNLRRFTPRLCLQTSLLSILGLSSASSSVFASVWTSSCIFTLLNMTSEIFFINKSFSFGNSLPSWAALFTKKVCFMVSRTVSISARIIVIPHRLKQVIILPITSAGSPLIWTKTALCAKCTSLLKPISSLRVMLGRRGIAAWRSSFAESLFFLYCRQRQYWTASSTVGKNQCAPISCFMFALAIVASTRLPTMAKATPIPLDLKCATISWMT